MSVREPYQMSATVLNWILGIIGGFIMGLTGWVMGAEGRLSGMEAVMDSHGQRTSQLEQGVTTPMAAATRERFDAHQQRIEANEHALGTIREQLREILDRLPRRAVGSRPVGPSVQGG